MKDQRAVAHMGLLVWKFRFYKLNLRFPLLPNNESNLGVIDFLEVRTGVFLRALLLLSSGSDP